MKRTMRILLTGAITLLLSTMVIAAGYKIFSPSADFSADLIMTITPKGSGQKQVMQGKVYVTKDGMERREFQQGGRTFIVITNRKTGESHTLMPEQKMYMINTDDSPDDPQKLISDGEMTITKKGSEILYEHNTDVYVIKSTDKAEETFDGLAWLTKKHNIPVLIKGTSGNGTMAHDFQMEWRKHDIRKQPGHLFKIPKDWKAMNSGYRMKAPPGSGHKDIKLPPGLTPEQIEQLKKIMQQKKGG